MQALPELRAANFEIRQQNPVNQKKDLQEKIKALYLQALSEMRAANFEKAGKISANQKKICIKEISSLNLKALSETEKKKTHFENRMTFEPDSH